MALPKEAQHLVEGAGSYHGTPGAGAKHLSCTRGPVPPSAAQRPHCAVSPSLASRASEDAVGGHEDGAERHFLENRPLCQSVNPRKNDNRVSQPSAADWGKQWD